MKLTRGEYLILSSLVKDEIQKGYRGDELYTVKKFEALFNLEKKIKKLYIP